MADDFAHRRNQSANNAIPLQNLTQDGAPERTGTLPNNESHRRTLSERGRALFGRNTRNSRGGRANAPYAPVRNHGEGSPTPQSRTPLSPVAFVTTPSGQHERIPDEDDEATLSPIVDVGAFQSAIGFAGLSFNAEHSSDDTADDEEIEADASSPMPGQRVSRRTLDSLPPLNTRNSTDMISIELNDGPAFYSPGVMDDDRLPLTDSSRLQASNHAARSSPAGQRHDRDRRKGNPLIRGLSARFAPGQTDNRSRSGSARLGDDLATAELGSSVSGSDLGRMSSSSRRSLSPGVESPLQRTGTMLRKMSQRVVNLSNESEPIERERSTTRGHSMLPAPQSEEPPNEHAEASMDGAGPPRSPASEKLGFPLVAAQETSRLPMREVNPLRGKSLGIFSPESKIRKALLRFLVHPLVEPFILVLIVVQTVVLAIESAPDVYNHPRPINWGTSWTDWLLLGIFAIYTAEIIIKVMVSGLIFNPTEYSTIDRSIGVWEALKQKASDLFALHRKPSKRGPRGGAMDPNVPAPESLLRSFTTQNLEDIPGSSRQAAQQRLAHRAFLRHSFNRLDFVAVVSFWISFVLGAAGVEYDKNMYVFRMMSSLRILRLLGITSGTSVILRSLKRAAPTLLNIAILIGFFWLLFSIIGVQIFKSSLGRTCTFLGDPGNPPPYNNTQNQPPPAGNFQFCGGWLAENLTAMPWLKADGSWGTQRHKGYLCPVGSQCIEGGNPYNNTISFDNILQSSELVFVIMTSNTFTDIMYYLMDSDYLAAALFSAFGIIFLTFWLISLLIAVITSAFQVIRDESRSSAFMAEADLAEDEVDGKGSDGSPSRVRHISSLKRTYQKFNWVWIIVIVFDLVVQSLRTDTMGTFRKDLINTTEVIVTLILLCEIIFRFVSDWRDFRHHRRNWFDLFLAIMTCIIQLPVIKNSGDPYAWLTVFQILRIYRVVLAVQMTRDLIMLVLRHVSGVLNLIVFVFLLTFLGAIFAAQLFRGQLPILDLQGNYIQVTFATIFNSFLGMYQVLSSENWTTVMYNVARFDYNYGTAWIGATFFIIWFTLANFVVLNMFIAVIQENFDVSEDQKRMQQVKMFLQRKEMGSGASGTLSLSTIFKFGMMRRQDPLDFGNAAGEMLLKDAVVRDFLDEEMEEDGERTRTATGGLSSSNTLNLIKQPANIAQRVQEKVSELLFGREPNPFYARLQLTKPSEELDPRTLAKEVMAATEERKVSQREYLKKYPTYNVSLFIFKPGNPIRKFCQRIVGPGRGVRIQGVQPNVTIWYSFSAFIYAAIVGMVLLACVTTPLYQLEYFQNNPSTSDRYNWFTFTDIGFAALFTVEGIIKVIADGFFWTPNAYFRSSWGFIDGVVLVTLWVNVVTSLYDPGSGSRAVGAFKALRALRLLNISDSARDTFHSVIVLGGWKVLSAAFVSLSLLIPFAIYGLNLFAGKMSWCNDWQQYLVHNLTDCVGESVFSPIGYDMLAPRRVAPVDYAYDFDSFGDALFVLFQVVSQEGWIDLMWSGQSITGVFTQPAWFSQQGNAVYFVVFNLLGAVFVLTLFVSVFMRNYTEQTGVAFLTSEQRSWLELRKILRQVAPSKRPNQKKQRQNWQEWSYRRAVTKNGPWQRTITGILIAHLILLCLEWYPEPEWWSLARFYIFFVFILFYIANIAIRIMGLSWFRFRKSAWDVYSLIFVFAAFVTSIMVFGKEQNGYYSQIHKLVLVAVSLLLIPRNNQLDQLFKTAAASFSAIANLLATWFVLFLVYAIAFTQTFGLTRFGPNETDNINFRTVPKALILLFRLSVGEGWNQIMLDYANIVPPYCTVSDIYYQGDCGSKHWSYALFVSWNIISMYIFVNLFISLIYESFSYVYQRSSGLSVISREEIRRFKQAWAEFDPNGTGYISKVMFPRFLGELSGIFEMRIYDGDFSIQQLIEDCRVTNRRTSSLPVDGAESATTQIDLAKLNKRLAELPVDEIRRRRARMNTFYEEVIVSADPDRGISFNSLLMVLAHYKVINDNKSLKLEEFLRRRARLQRVEEAVNRNIVVGFFDTLYWSRKFRRRMDAKKDARMTMIPTFGVPEILVHDEDGEGITPTRDADFPAVSVSLAGHDSGDGGESLGIGRAPSSGSDGGGRRASSLDWRNRSGSIQLSPSASPTREEFSLAPRHRPTASNNSIQPDWHFAAAIEGGNRISPPGSPGLGDAEATAARSRANSTISQDEMVGMFQDSAWGQSMRRSFTQRRPNDRRPS